MRNRVDEVETVAHAELPSHRRKPCFDVGLSRSNRCDVDFRSVDEAFDALLQAAIARDAPDVDRERHAGAQTELVPKASRRRPWLWGPSADSLNP